MHNTDLYQWRKKATRKQWDKLAELTGTSTAYLNQLAYGNRNPSSKLAGKLEDASKEIGDMPELSKEKLIFG